MKYIRNAAQINAYFDRVPLAELFSFDIRPFASVVQFDPEETILREGERPQYLYYLIGGRAKLYLSHNNGRVSLINFMEAPCFIGEMELLNDAQTASGVTALTSCTCFAVPMRTCGERLLSDNKFLRCLCGFLSQKALCNTQNYSRNQSYPLDVRLAGFIQMTAVGMLYRERHTEVAEYLGVTYRHLLYVLAGFVKQGILAKEKQGYRILDAAALEKIAHRI